MNEKNYDEVVSIIIHFRDLTHRHLKVRSLRR